jgi:hypothetical protein
MGVVGVEARAVRVVLGVSLCIGDTPAVGMLGSTTAPYASQRAAAATKA